MGTYNIITIGREFGSGGREVGLKLSERLGIPIYDKEILEEASKKSGYTKELFEKHDEKPTGSFLYSLALGTTGYGGGYQRPLILDIYLAQFDTIRKLAKDGPGIFIGRCSDYVLADFPGSFHVFINSDMENRVSRIMQKMQVNEKKAKEIIIKADKDRASFYNYYSNHIWGDSRHYDICLNTGKFGIDGAVDIIEKCVK